MKTPPAIPLRLPSTLPPELPEQWPEFPSGRWPKTLKMPSFRRWQATGRASAVRNLIALLLLELNLPRHEVASFLELSPGRTLAVARAMRVRLFGKDFEKYEERLNRDIVLAGEREGSKHLLVYALQNKQKWPREKLQAILYAMDSMASDYHDFQLWHATLELLSRKRVEFDPQAIANEA